MALVSLRDVSFGYGGRHLIEHVRKDVAARDYRGALATQLAAAIAARDPKVVDAAYADLRAAGERESNRCC